MKKITSLFLVLVCCLTMGIPTFAADTTHSVDVLTRSELLELKNLPKNEIGGFLMDALPWEKRSPKCSGTP